MARLLSEVTKSVGRATTPLTPRQDLHLPQFHTAPIGMDIDSL